MDRGHNTWAITSYFNPMRYQTRRSNYYVFRKHLAIPLATVELSFNGHFDLNADDADVMIRNHGRDIMWHKERLLNLAVHALPESCRNVVWIDCDVVFERRDWHEETAELLDRYALVQPFTTQRHVPRGTPHEHLHTISPVCTQPALAAEIDRGKPVLEAVTDSRPRLHGLNGAGMAWAARKDLVRRHGLYDACVVGGADRILAGSAWGFLDPIASRLYLNPWQARHFRRWAEPFYATVDGRVRSLAGNIAHLWHGDLNNRRTIERYRNLQPYDFDPEADLAYDGRDGLLRWNSEKPALHEYVKNHFVKRREDG